MDCHLHPAIVLVQGVFWYHIFQFQISHLVFLFPISLLRHSIFPFISRELTLNCCSIFIKPALNLSQMIPTSVSSQYWCLMIISAHLG